MIRRILFRIIVLLSLLCQRTTHGLVVRSSQYSWKRVGRRMLVEVSQTVVEAGSPDQRPHLATEMIKRAEYPHGKYNGLIVSLMLGTALSAVLFRDVMAISSLFVNDHAMEADWLPESIKLLARLPYDIYSDYGNAALIHPVWIKAWTSAVSYLIGDCIAQIYEGRRRIDALDLPRSFRNAASGFLLHGPIIHYWIQFLEHDLTSAALVALHLSAIPPHSSVEYGLIASKIVLDQTLFAFCFNSVYTIFIGLLCLKDATKISDSLKTTLIPSIIASWKFWPIIHLLTYSPIIAEQYKLLWIDFAEIAWVSILSVLSNAEKDQDNQVSKANIVEEFDVQPAVEVLLARYVEKHGLDNCLDPNALDLSQLESIERNDPVLATRLRTITTSIALAPPTKNEIEDFTHAK